MKINVLNKAAIEAALAKGQTQARTRLATYDDVERLAADAERHLLSMGLPLSRHEGAIATSCEGDLPLSYRYRATSTRIVLRRGSKTWFLETVTRHDIRPGQRTLRDVRLSQEQVSYLAAQLAQPQAI